MQSDPCELERHTGVVSAINDDGCVTVQLPRDSACAHCPTKGTCGMQEAGNLVIKNQVIPDAEPGDTVEITVSRGGYYRSVMAIYILPLIVVVVVALAAGALLTSQLGIALVTLAALVGYFVALRLVIVRRGESTMIRGRVLFKAKQ